MTFFRGFRRLFEAIEELGRAIERLARIQEELGPALDRLNALELSRHHFEAECEGMLLKADGKLKAASSAEQRERQLKRANERLADPFDVDSKEGEEAGDAVRRFDAEAFPEKGVPAVRLGLATNNKAHALRAKWS